MNFDTNLGEPIVGPRGPRGPMGHCGPPGLMGKCECKDQVDNLIKENEQLKEKLLILEARVNELYYAPDAPGFINAQISYNDLQKLITPPQVRSIF